MITPGTLLIQAGTILPESIQLKNDLTANGWTAVRSSAGVRQLKADLRAAGWNYFYMAVVKQRGFGRDSAKRMVSAMKRVTAKMRLENCNSVQIDEIAAHSFWGIPYLRVSAHCFHIQKGIIFAGARE
jgi:hypothetical protein